MPTRPQSAVECWDDACKHLSKRDRVMRKLIPRFGDGRLQIGAHGLHRRQQSEQQTGKNRQTHREEEHRWV